MTPTQALVVLGKIPWPSGVLAPTIVHLARDDGGSWRAAFDKETVPFMAHGVGNCGAAAVRAAGFAWLHCWRIRAERQPPHLATHALDDVACTETLSELVRMTTD